MTSRPHAPLTLLLLLVPALGLTSGQVQAARSYDSCSGFITSIPATITTQGTWCLDRDLSTSLSTGAAITVQTNNVTIDCNDFKLGGLAAGPVTLANGIQAAARLNTTVRNCNIRGFRKGVLLSGGGHTVEDSRFELNLEAGIDLRGDGGIVRRNLVRDTGEGTGVPIAIGIYAEGSTDVYDNHVQGVTGLSGGDTSTRGIWSFGGTGSRVARNTVRDLLPSAGATMAGIYTSFGYKVMLDDNRVTAPVNVAGSVGYRCNLNDGSMRGNSAWGFSQLTSQCFDDGGNVQR